MNKTHLSIALLLGVSLISPLFGDGAPFPEVKRIGIINFQKVYEESKQGKEAASSMQALETQLSSTVQETEKELQEIAQKAQDPEYRDSLSPEAEKEMMQRGQMLAGQLNEQKGQFMQIMNQAEMRAVQELKVQAMRSAQVIAKTESLDLVLPDNATFYFRPEFDITTKTITEIDKLYDSESAEKKAPEAPSEEAS